MKKRIPTDEEIAAMPHVPPVIAGAYLGRDAQFIRFGLQYKELPFGTAIKRDKWTYHIPGPALVRYKQYGAAMKEDI